MRHNTKMTNRSLKKSSRKEYDYFDLKGKPITAVNNGGTNLCALGYIYDEDYDKPGCYAHPGGVIDEVILNQNDPTRGAQPTPPINGIYGVGAVCPANRQYAESADGLTKGCYLKGAGEVNSQEQVNDNDNNNPNWQPTAFGPVPAGGCITGYIQAGSSNNPYCKLDDLEAALNSPDVDVAVDWYDGMTEDAGCAPGFEPYQTDSGTRCYRIGLGDEASQNTSSPSSVLDDYQYQQLAEFRRFCCN